VWAKVGVFEANDPGAQAAESALATATTAVCAPSPSKSKSIAAIRPACLLGTYSTKLEMTLRASEPKSTDG
jgi:hypothetical protein